MLTNGLIKQIFIQRKLFAAGIALLLLFCPASPLYAQGDTTGRAEIRHLMDRFRELQAAAIAGDSAAVSQKSAAFIQTLNTIDYKILSEGNHHILLKDASIISETTTSQNKKEAMENLSRNMEVLVRSFDFKDSTR